jgi:hypothetical protein
VSPRRQSVVQRLEIVTDGVGVNEDLAGSSPPLYWVLDGSTPLFPKRVEDSRSDAEWLVQRIDEWLRSAPIDRTERDLREVIASLATVLGRDFKRAGLSKEPEGPSAAIALVRMLGHRVEYAILGDISVVVRSNRRLHHFRDERVAKFDRLAVDLLKKELDAGSTFDRASAAVRATLRENRKYMNVQPGYWILTNRARAARHAVAGSLRLGKSAEVLVASDGFTRAVDIFRLHHGWSGLLSTVRDQAMTGTIAQLRSAERRDPQCRKFPRLSPADDATALYLRVAVSSG